VINSDLAAMNALRFLTVAAPTGGDALGWRGWVVVWRFEIRAVCAAVGWCARVGALAA